ncbi:hypothetical protein PIB30_096242 [Stylosanthes scabra]|uniref:Uncharacterized protein n=1 Tax=Stylosanthes scabra TaxID=79078 RepID=A0ABU6SW95_9FABA|nr:hypothetical protein [Stylosanthes scabra]
MNLDVTVDSDSVGRLGMGQDDRTRSLSLKWFMALDRFNPLKWIGLASTRYRFYRIWVIVRPVSSTKLCRPRDNLCYINYPANGSRERELELGSGVIYYEYEKREKFEDYDMEAEAELGIFKIRRYHFDDESFVHPLHSVRFDPNRPYEIPIEALMADKILSSSKNEKSFTRRSRSSRRPTPHYSPRGMPVAQRERSTSSVKGTRSFRYGTTSSSLRNPRSWELIPPSEGWMCHGDDEKEFEWMKHSVKKDESSEEDSKEEDPEEEEEEPEQEQEDNHEDGIPATPSLPMGIDAEEDYQRYI